jgi:MoxR-like ATPase
MKRIMEEAPTNDPGESSSSVKEILSRARAEVGKVIIGQEDVIDFSLIAIFTGNHILVEGVPGVAKTLLVRTLARVLGAEFSRIQFTPDLMPSDITGTNIFNIQEGDFHLVKGTNLYFLPARRRNQPRPGKNSVGASPGDAGATGHD